MSGKLGSGGEERHIGGVMKGRSVESRVNNEKDQKVNYIKGIQNKRRTV